MKCGYLILLTGIDGSGKTTQAEILVENLKKDGFDVAYVWARWKQIITLPVTFLWKMRLKKVSNHKDSRAREVRPQKEKLLKNPVIRWLWLAIFLIDYGLQILIKVRLKRLYRSIIVSDRMFYDSIIDQSINLGSMQELLLNNLESLLMRMIFPVPDIVIYIDCPPEIAFLRKPDVPDLEYLEERRKLYRLLADKYNWLKIDGALPVKKIASIIHNNVNKKLN